MTDNAPMNMEKLYICLTEKGDGIYLTNLFCNAGYWPFSVQYLNST